MPKNTDKTKTNGNETKAEVISSNLTSHLFYLKILKYLNDSSNKNFSVL